MPWPARAAPRRVTINTALTVSPARIVLNDQDHLVAPVVMVVEGVLNGGLIPGTELHPQDWNGVAVTVGHPQDEGGLPHSARQPQVLAACGVGQVFHVRQGTGQRQGHPVASLQGELWINLAQVARCGGDAPQAVAMLESQTALECSTAFFSEAVRQPGSFYGTPYLEIHRHLRPDHLALLPNETGACSWQDGCGAPRLNHATLTYTSMQPGGCACLGTSCTCHAGERPMEDVRVPGWRRFVQVLRDFVSSEESVPVPPEEESPGEDPDGAPPEEEAVEDEEETQGAAPLNAHMTDGDTRESLYGALAREQGVDTTMVFIDSVDPETQTFTFRQGERLRRRRWHMQDGVLVLDPATEDVQRSTAYTAVPTTEAYQEESLPMPATQSKRWVDALIANHHTSWTEEDRGTLEGFGEAALLRMVQDVERLPAPPAPREGYLSVNEALTNVEPEEREAVSAAIQTYKRHKDQLIELILANTQNPFPRDKLQAMNADDLSMLVRMAGDVVPGETPERGGNYSGRRMPPIRLVTEEDDIPAPPAHHGTGCAATKRTRPAGVEENCDDAKYYSTGGDRDLSPGSPSRRGQH